MKPNRAITLAATLLALVACDRQPPADVSPPAAASAAPTGAAANQPGGGTLDPAQLRLSYAMQQDALPPAGQAEFAVTLQNGGTVVLPASGPRAAYVTYHWLDETGKVLQWENPRTTLSEEVPPGQSRLVRFPVVAPRDPGTYILKVVTGLADGTDFEAAGQAPLHYRIKVG